MKNDVMMLAELIQEKLGIDMTAQTDSLKRKLSGRMQSLGKTPWEYLCFLRTHSDEWEHVIDLVTINETYFFREDEQLAMLKTVLGSIKKKKK